MSFRKRLPGLVSVCVVGLLIAAPVSLGQSTNNGAEQDQQGLELKSKVDECRRGFDKDDPRLADALEKLANHLSNRKEFAESIPLLVEAAAIRRKHFDPARYKEIHPESGTQKSDPSNPGCMYENDLENLRWAFVFNDQYKQSEVPSRQLVELREKHLGAWSRWTGSSHLLLAVSCDKAGDYKEAEESAQKAMAIEVKLRGPLDKNLIPILVVLAHIYVNMQDDVRVEQVYKRELSILAATDPKGPWRAGVLEDYAELMRRTGRTREAKSMEAEAKKIRAIGKTPGN